MRSKKNQFKILFILFFLFVFGINKVNAANYSLEIINIKPAGTGNPAISENNRIFRAYPGIEYSIRPSVIGGLYPFKYYLTNEPQGMIIDENTGKIIWQNPQSDASNIILTVEDSEGVTVQTSWSIAVTTNGFLFVDVSVSDGGDGTLGNPFNNWLDFYLGNSDATYNNYIVYFKNGVYNYPLQYVSETAGSSNRLPIINHPKIFLGFPGEENVFFDGEKETNRIHLYSVENDLYFQNIDFINGYGFNIEPNGGNYFTAIDCTFSNINGSGSLSNQGAISFRGVGPLGFEPPESNLGFKMYNVIEYCEFTNFYNNEAGIEDYGTRKASFSNNYFENLGVGIHLKDGNDQTSIKNNIFKEFQQAGILILAQQYAFNADISFNYINNEEGVAIQVGGYEDQAGPGPTHIYRNTISGSFWFREINEDDGPIYIRDNVIVNDNEDWAYIRDNIGEHYSIVSEKSVLNNNLLGSFADNIVDQNGFLTDNYSVYRGTHGWEIFSSDTIPPSHPTGLSVN